jgi:hypothetical protein
MVAITVLGRLLKHSDCWKARAVVLLTGYPIVHVELVVPRACTGVACGYEGGMRCRPGITHRVSYSVYYGERSTCWQRYQHERVFARADREYDAAVYRSVTIHLTNANFQRLVTFLDAQVGTGFNRLGYLFNFWTPLCRGCRLAELTPKAWFCSELVSTALAYANVLQLQIHPCKISPGLLMTTLESATVSASGRLTQLATRSQPLLLPAVSNVTVTIT